MDYRYGAGGGTKRRAGGSDGNAGRFGEEGGYANGGVFKEDVEELNLLDFADRLKDGLSVFLNSFGNGIIESHVAF